MKKHFNTKISVFFLIIFLFRMQAAYAANSSNNYKNILVLNSYNQKFIWTDDVLNGISSVFNESLQGYNLYVDNMDLKANDTEDYLKNFYNMEESKYKNIKIDIIICSDNGALDYLLKYRDSLFSKIPVVFCGVNPPYSDSANKDNLYTGITENISTKEMLQTIIKFHPNLETLNIFSGSTTTGKITAEDIKNTYNNMGYKFKCNYYTDSSVDLVKKVLSDSGENSAALFGADPIRDHQNKPVYLKNLNDSFFKDSKVPIYSFWNFELGYGAVGGKLVTGFSQGQFAAKTALKILQTDKIEDVKLLNQDQNQYIFDYNKLKQFKIQPNSLPEKSIIINKPFSFYETYKPLVISTVVIFVLLISLLVILAIFFRQKAHSEKEINSSYEELSAVYEQLAATEEELRAQFDELTHTEELVRDSEERFRLAVAGANDVIYEWIIISDKLFLSDAWTEISGYNEKEIEGLSKFLSEIVYSDDLKILIDEFYNCINGVKDLFRCELRIKTKEGKYKWILQRGKILRDKLGNGVKMSGSLTDISERKAYEKQIEHMAYYDSLTLLPNRRYFIAKANELIINNESFSLMFLDLDEFKKINDTLGHHLGDELLKMLSRKLECSVPKGTTVSRFGGDEFLILMPKITDHSELKKVAANILNIFKEPFNINSSLNYVTASIGIGVFPEDGNDIDALLKNVDTAMYKAKEMGKDQYCFFKQIMGEEILKTTIIENELRNALKNNELLIYYQPQIDMKTGKLVGMEALIRWNNKKLGFVPPNEFIYIAEKNGLIIPIGIWILQNVCSQIKLWKSKKYKFSSIAINVSPIQIKQIDFLKVFSNIIKGQDFSPDLIEIEITESLLIDNVNENIEKLEELKKLGVKIALDDFGTGYSSLNYLSILPIDTVKIDKSFIDNICSISKENMIANELINLTHKLNYNVVAEGVETCEQVNILTNMNCDFAQGYYYSKPLNKEAMEELLKSNASECE